MVLPLTAVSSCLASPQDPFSSKADTDRDGGLFFPSQHISMLPEPVMPGSTHTFIPQVHTCVYCTPGPVLAAGNFTVTEANLVLPSETLWSRWKAEGRQVM